MTRCTGAICILCSLINSVGRQFVLSVTIPTLDMANLPVSNTLSNVIPSYSRYLIYYDGKRAMSIGIFRVYTGKKWMGIPLVPFMKPTLKCKGKPEMGFPLLLVLMCLLFSI